MRELAIVLPIDVVLCINARKAANSAPGSRSDAFSAKLEACVIRSPVARKHVQPAQRFFTPGLATRRSDIGGLAVADPLATQFTVHWATPCPSLGIAHAALLHVINLSLGDSNVYGGGVNGWPCAGGGVKDRVFHPRLKEFRNRRVGVR